MPGNLAAPFLFPLLLGLAACGGSPGGSSTNLNISSATPGAAQGAYSGTLSSPTNSYTLQTIVLPNDRIYAFYGTSNFANGAAGVILGQGRSSGGVFTGELTNYVRNGNISQGAVNANYSTNASLSGTFVTDSVTLTITASAPPTTSWNYNAATTQSTIAGTWNGLSLDGHNSTVVLEPDGRFTGNDESCTFTGTVTPDSSGKNFYNLNIGFSGSACVVAGTTASGVAVTYLLPDGIHRQLLIAAASGNAAMVFVGNR